MDGWGSGVSSLARCVFCGMRPFLSLNYLRPERVRLYSWRPSAGRVVFSELKPCLASPGRLLVAWEAK